MHMTTDVCAPRSILPTHPYARTISYGTDVLTHGRTPTHRHVYTHITGIHALPYLWFDYFDLKYYYAGFLGITLRAVNFYTHLAPKVDTIVTSHVRYAVSQNRACSYYSHAYLYCCRRTERQQKDADGEFKNRKNDKSKLQ